MSIAVRTWGDHLEPISAVNGLGEIIGRHDLYIPGSENSMTREYVNTEWPEPGPNPTVTWFTAEDGSMFFNPFGRATGFRLPLSTDILDFAGHAMWLGERDYFEPPDPMPIPRYVFGFTYMDDPDFVELEGETLTTAGLSFQITDQGRIGGGEQGQLLDPGEDYYWPTACGKLAPVT